MQYKLKVAWIKFTLPLRRFFWFVGIYLKQVKEEKWLPVWHFVKNDRETLRKISEMNKP